MSDTLPPMPEPTLEDHEYELWGQNVRSDFFTADQMRAYAAAAVAMERERCATLCLEVAEGLRQEGDGCTDGRYDWKADGAEDCASEIRAG